jgi:hypothetical protein
MNDRTTRTFIDAPGTRDGGSPLFIGLSGPSGGGKTYSALRLATGIQRVVGGEIFGIDTEADRMNHYSDKFKFRHVPFGAPFSPLDYLDCIEHCIARGAKTVIIDSMSHEHAGTGGVLEEHDEEAERLSKLWRTTYEKASTAAWAKPKAKRAKLINRILQIKGNFIFCFRAKEKVKLGGGDVKPLGFMPIAGDEYVYEMTCNALLLPNAGGVPTWNPIEIGEKQMVKLPSQFKEYFKGERPFDEDAGQFMAEWAGGVVPTKPPTADQVSALIKNYETCDSAGFAKLETDRKAWWSMIKPQQAVLKTVSDQARGRLGL